MLRKGKSVKARHDVKASGWGGDTVKAGSKGVIIAESTWSNKYKVTFTDQGWGNKDVTVDDLTADDIQEY